VSKRGLTKQLVLSSRRVPCSARSASLAERRKVTARLPVNFAIDDRPRQNRNPLTFLRIDELWRECVCGSLGCVLSPVFGARLALGAWTIGWLILGGGRLNLVQSPPKKLAQ
jgi:hypothetical protein